MFLDFCHTLSSWGAEEKLTHTFEGGLILTCYETSPDTSPKKKSFRNFEGNKLCHFSQHFGFFWIANISYRFALSNLSAGSYLHQKGRIVKLGAEKQNLHFFSTAFHMYLMFLFFFFLFPQVFVTHCVPDLKLDRLSGMYSIWHVKFLLLLPAIHGSKCHLYFLNICNKFQPRSQLMGVWVFFPLSFFLPLIMPKGLRANLNVADISSVVPYPEQGKGGELQ